MSQTDGLRHRGRVRRSDGAGRQRRAKQGEEGYRKMEAYTPYPIKDLRRNYSRSANFVSPIVSDWRHQSAAATAWGMRVLHRRYRLPDQRWRAVRCIAGRCSFPFCSS